MDKIVANVKCPYFLGDNIKSLRINCESCNEESVMSTLTFKTNKKRDEYIRDFCACGCWKGCVVARMIEEKYAK
jgi:hypothetical protein